MKKPSSEGFVLILPIVHEIVFVERLIKQKSGQISKYFFLAFSCQPFGRLLGKAGNND